MADFSGAGPGGGTKLNVTKLSRVLAPATYTTTSTTYKMAGFSAVGSAWKYTPTLTGKLYISASLIIWSDTDQDGVSAFVAWGTGTAPTAGDADPVANKVGATNGVSIYAPVAGSSTNPTAQITDIGYVLAPLVIGTTYWFDVAIKALVGGTAGVSNLLTIFVFE